MKRFPGEVYYLDAEAGGDPGVKVRRHVLLTECDESSPICTFAYCSTQPTEAMHSAPYYLLDPSKTRYTGTGFNKATYVYPARLVIAAVDQLGSQAGRVVDDMLHIRECLRDALGLGSGTGAEHGRAAGSMRGQIVALTAGMTEQAEATHAVIVTEPRYSMELRHQTVLPINDAEEFEPRHYDVLIQDAEWLTRCGLPYHNAVLSVEFVWSLFYPEHVRDETGVVVDSATMNEIDDMLQLRFGL